MPVYIAPTCLVPLGDQPIRILVRIDEALFKSLGPLMESLAPKDSVSRVRRKGEASLEQMIRDVSRALFGAELAPGRHIGGGQSTSDTQMVRVIYRPVITPE